jgi:hypothetical protein
MDPEQYIHRPSRENVTFSQCVPSRASQSSALGSRTEVGKFRIESEVIVFELKD